MIRYVMASSSSKGNAAFIYSETTLIQVDMGVTLSTLKKAISLTPYRLEDIHALLVTHEHSDHIKGMSLSCYKHLNIDTFAGEGTLKEPTHVVNISDNLQAIGGKDNVLSHSLSGSRIILHLKDYSKVEREKLKKAGAIGFIMKSDKLTIVFKENAKDVYQNLFKE